MGHTKPTKGEICLGASTLLCLSLTLAILWRPYSGLPKAFLARYQPKLPADIHRISIQQAQLMLHRDDVLFVDARSEPEYRSGHIPRSIRIDPLQVERIPNYQLNRLNGAHLIVVYCSSPSCGAARKVAKALKSKGVPRIFVMEEGWWKWIQAGMPIEK